MLHLVFVCVICLRVFCVCLLNGWFGVLNNCKGLSCGFECSCRLCVLLVRYVQISLLCGLVSCRFGVLFDGIWVNRTWFMGIGLMWWILNWNRLVVRGFEVGIRCL